MHWLPFEMKIRFSYEYFWCSYTYKIDFKSIQALQMFSNKWGKNTHKYAAIQTEMCLNRWHWKEWMKNGFHILTIGKTAVDHISIM